MKKRMEIFRLKEVVYICKSHHHTDTDYLEVCHVEDPGEQLQESLLALLLFIIHYQTILIMYVAHAVLYHLCKNTQLNMEQVIALCQMFEGQQVDVNAHSTY